jgi:hypothetical protein
MKDAKWYNLTIRKTFSVFVDETIPYQPKDNASEADKISDAYQWAFTGDAYNGIVLYNKKTGAGYTLTKDGENTVMKEGDPYSWTIGKNGDGFTLRETGADINVINHRNRQYLGLWQNGSLTSDGSTFLISEVPVIEDFSQAVTDEIAPWFEASKYFVLSDAAKAEVGYQESYKTLCTQAQYESMKAILDEKKADIANFVLPETGFYRLRNYKWEEGRYMTYSEKDGTPVINTAVQPAEAISNIIRFTKTDDNRYTIAVGGLYATAPEKDVINVLDRTGAEFRIVVSKPGFGAFTTGEQYGALHSPANANYYCVGWKDTSDASQWALEDATINGIDVTITEAGYATLNALFPVTIPEGVTAYTGLIAGSWLTLNELTGTIPAATPVVLAGEPGTYSFAFTDDAAAVENDLKGTYEACKPEGAFTLQVINGQIGFYSFSGEAIPANKAYITLPAGTEVKSLGITFDNATAITDIANGKNGNGHCFNLAGLRVNSTQKGVYILNGKKVVKF